MTNKNFVIDMDGVLIEGNHIIPGADKFISSIAAKGSKFLILTNNSMYTPGDLAHRLQTMGLEISEKNIFTSAMATALFLQKQNPQGKAYVIGESGLTEAIHNVGYIITDLEPDYVVLGETHTYNLDLIKRGVRFISEGSRFIATNPDPNGPGEGGIIPACGAMAALIEKASGVSPLFIGKPSPLIMRTALNYLGVHSEDTYMVGDRMDTDIVAGMNGGMETILVLSGVTQRNQVARFPYRPTFIYDSVADITV